MAGSSYPPQPSSAELEHIVSEIKDWSIAHGLTVRPPPTFVSAEVDPHGVLATTAPVTLYPSPFPYVCFDQAKAIQKTYNELYASIARDEAFLQDIVEEILEVDEFIAALWQIHLKVKQEGYVQHLALGLFRSDYMVHQDNDAERPAPIIKQVEFNTIASSFGGLSLQTAEMHRRYLVNAGYIAIPENGATSGDPVLPHNTSTHSLASGLRTAFHAYEDARAGHQLCILFIVQEPERNIFDQRHLEYDLSGGSPVVPVFRLPFNQILEQTTVSQSSTRELLYRPPSSPLKVYEVAVVYYRSGYGPADYPNASAWQARLQVERSNAIKCPSILTQLAGTKKVQQVLATPTAPSTPSILGRFMQQDTACLPALQDTFANIFPLDDSPAGLEARKIALDPARCRGYVLKPQREGGGNNIYRAAIPPFLRALPETHWKSYILMEIITPPPIHNLILRSGVVEKGGVICELGVYGTCLWHQLSGKVLHNEEAGYLLRTKGDQSEEGGVAAGFGAMDSVVLV
ncbi:MAG: hypothetical protein M1818_000343 [Claussenomyces sp. TS43310]|nr:MAG: hypothetical protein M1818_000343 [Claussenomyces sp. TS43310]